MTIHEHIFIENICFPFRSRCFKHWKTQCRQAPSPVHSRLSAKEDSKSMRTEWSQLLSPMVSTLNEIPQPTEYICYFFSCFHSHENCIFIVFCSVLFKVKCDRTSFTLDYTVPRSCTTDPCYIIFIMKILSTSCFKNLIAMDVRTYIYSESECPFISHS